MRSVRTTKMLVAALLSLLMVLQLTACSFDFLGKKASTEAESTESGAETADTVATTAERTTEPRKETVMKTYQIAENLDHIKVIGRSSTLAEGITCDWSASGISFNLDCVGDVVIKLSSQSVSFFTVIVDGVRKTERVQVMGADARITIAKDLEGGLHSFSLLKQTENANSMCVLSAISFDGEFAAKPADQSLYIEFYGDSITSGYGNLVTSTNKPTDDSASGTAVWQDGTQTYAFRLAEALGADWSMISVSGIPFSKGYTQFTMGEIMEKINFRRGDAAYSFARKPDLVVINLGTNDQQCNADMNDVKAKAEAMIQTLKGRYGADQKILLVTCMMNQNCRTQLLEVIQACGGEASGIYEMQSFESNRLGGNGHPNMTAHIDVAEELEIYIRANILRG